MGKVKFLAKYALGIVVAASLTACTVAPGMSGFRLSNKSNVEVPVGKPGAAVPKNVDIKPITAQLIIDDEKRRALQARPAGGVGKVSGYRYRIGPGDVLSITVWDHPELTIPAGSFRAAEQAGTVVNDDGTIYYPYAGVIKVWGKTLPQVRAILTEKLAGVIEKIKLDVRIAAFRSQRVYVSGEVKEPGVKEITDIPPTIAEMINRAGDFTEAADKSDVLLTRKGATTRIDVRALYETGDSRQNVLLKSGDIVFVPNLTWDKKVFVLGEVNRPGPYTMKNGRKSLAEAIGDASDINQVTADARQIFVIRSGSGKPQIFHLSSKSPDSLLLADRFPLEARDVVFVDAAPVVQWNRVISQILPTSQVLWNASRIEFPLFDGQGRL